MFRRLIPVPLVLAAAIAARHLRAVRCRGWAYDHARSGRGRRPVARSRLGEGEDDAPPARGLHRRSRHLAMAARRGRAARDRAPDPSQRRSRSPTLGRHRLPLGLPARIAIDAADTRGARAVRRLPDGPGAAAPFGDRRDRGQRAESQPVLAAAIQSRRHATRPLLRTWPSSPAPTTRSRPSTLQSESGAAHLRRAASTGRTRAEIPIRRSRS